MTATNRLPRIAGCLLGVLLIVVGAVAQWGESIVRDHLLNDDFYSATLVEQRVYRRVYSEVLIDPGLRAATNRLLGDMTDGRGQASVVTAVSNALLRLALPPSTLRAATESALNRVLAYVRGDVDVLDATIDLSGALRGLDEAAEALLVEALTSLPALPAATIEQYRSQVDDIVAELERGAIPTAIPDAVAANIADSDVIAVLEAAARSGLPQTVIDQIVAAVRSGDDAGAIVAASATFVAAHLRSVQSDPALVGSLKIDLLDVLGPYAGERQEVVVGQIDDMRSRARWFPSWADLVAIAVLIVGVLIIVVSSFSATMACVWLASAFALSALTTWIASTLGAHWVSSPLESAASNSSSNSLPDSVVAVAADVDSALGDALRNSADGRVAALALVASAMVLPALAVTAITKLRTSHTRTIIAACTVLAITAGAASWWKFTPRTQADVRECNGHEELCDRPYDTVVQAATHNSMSSPDVVHIWPEHDSDITAQLDAGIRTLLIDTHYWTAIDRPAELDTIDQSLSPQLSSYLFQQLDDRLAARPGTYVCHARCAFGAAPLALTLGKVKEFLIANPNDVVTLIIQDAISVDDTESAFTDSELDAFLYRGDPTGGWPTIAEMIDAGERVVVFTENAGPPPDWYRPAFDLIQDTDYRVTSPTAFTCAIERGDPDAPLFLLNHWINRAAPDRADAAVINQPAFIVERARTCERERGRLPNFVAVNFFGIGDVMAAVDQLNDVGA